MEYGTFILALFDRSECQTLSSDELPGRDGAAIALSTRTYLLPDIS